MKFYKDEDRKLMELIKNGNLTILDVGCGEGRYLTPLVKKGFHVIGIDSNISTVQKLKMLGYNVYLPQEFNNINLEFDYIIMSHIIEHIDSHNLIKFLDTYLEKLKYGGELIIATPCLYDEFYDDYDHVRPYTPKAISFLYSDYQQLQAKPKFRLKLKYVWLRKWPISLRHYPGQSKIKYITSSFINILLFSLYKVKILSKTAGWIGVFEKIKEN